MFAFAIDSRCTVGRHTQLYIVGGFTLLNILTVKFSTMYPILENMNSLRNMEVTRGERAPYLLNSVLHKGVQFSLFKTQVKHTHFLFLFYQFLYLHVVSVF